MTDNRTRLLGRRINEAYELYRTHDPDWQKTLYLAFFAQADNVICYKMHASDTYLAHSVASRALTRLGTFQGRSKLSTWFYKLAQREVNRGFKARNLDRKRHVRLDADSDERSDREPAAPPVDLDNPISVERILNKLPKKQRDVMEMFLEGHSLEEIAHNESEPLGTIRSRYRLAKARAKGGPKPTPGKPKRQ